MAGWTKDAGMGTVSVDWNGHQIDAANPDPVAHASFALSETTVRQTERAVAASRRIADRSTGGLEVAALLLLRAEGLASSAIEGLRATANEVALAEANSDGVTLGGATAAWVADNLAVVTASLEEPGPLTGDVLTRWHRRLMRHAHDVDPRHVGVYRDRLGWVGGASPLVAVHVGAPPELIPTLLDDLTRLVTRTDLDAVSQAAIAHAQFEIIHPFADGNGRIGRVLAGWILARRLGVPVPPPVSLQFARDVGGYQSGLVLYRQGDVDTWVRWFAEAVEQAAETALRVLEDVEALWERWRAAAANSRVDSGARRLVELLPAHPVLSVRTASQLLGVSDQAGRNALKMLSTLGVVTEARPASRGPGRPRQWWVAGDLLRLLGA